MRGSAKSSEEILCAELIDCEHTCMFNKIVDNNISMNNKFSRNGLCKSNFLPMKYRTKLLDLSVRECTTPYIILNSILRCYMLRMKDIDTFITMSPYEHRCEFSTTEEPGPYLNTVLFNLSIKKTDSLTSVIKKAKEKFNILHKNHLIPPERIIKSLGMSQMSDLFAIGMTVQLDYGMNSICKEYKKEENMEECNGLSLPLWFDFSICKEHIQIDLTTTNSIPVKTIDTLNKDFLDEITFRLDNRNVSVIEQNKALEGNKEGKDE